MKQAKNIINVPLEDYVRDLVGQAKNIINVPLEDYVRDLVGAPTREEEEHCVCGAKLNNSTPDCYEHMTKGY